MAWIEIHNEATNGEIGIDWALCFQNCTYHYDDGSSERGYRFIWRRPNGSLQAARGQARIPDAETLFFLTDLAKKAGWFNG